MENNTITPERAKMIFLTLMEAAMRYREVFWRDDVEVLRKLPAPHKGGSIVNRKQLKLARKLHEKNHAKEVEVFEKQQEHFNKSIYLELDTVSASLGEKPKQVFDNMATIFATAIEEIVISKDRTKLLASMKLFNQGYFNNVFKEVEHLFQSEDTKQEKLPQQDSL